MQLRIHSESQKMSPEKGHGGSRIQIRISADSKVMLANKISISHKEENGIAE